MQVETVVNVLESSLYGSTFLRLDVDDLPNKFLDNVFRILKEGKKEGKQSVLVLSILDNK